CAAVLRSAARSAADQGLWEPARIRRYSGRRPRNRRRALRFRRHTCAAFSYNREMRRAALLLAAAIVAAAAADGPQYTSDGRMQYPRDYRQWVFLSSGLGMT